MKLLLSVFGAILLLGVAAMLTQIHHLANVAGFIASIGFLLVFFRDHPQDFSDEDAAKYNKFKKYWYFVFGFGLFFSLIFGSFWNNKMGGMI